MVAALAAGLLPTAALGRGSAGLDVQQSSYRGALTRARAALEVQGLSDVQRAARALTILQGGAAGEQEAIDLLKMDPPDLPGARTRLDTSIAAFSQAAVTDPDPITTEQRLRQVLAQGRYHPDQGPLAAIARFFRDLLTSILRPGQGLFSIIAILLLAGLVLLLVVLLVPALRNPLLRRQRVKAGTGLGPDGVPEYFGTAERLAKEGDFAGAVRALAAGTMELISGERSFMASPLTVRETFGRSGAVPVLRPLLQAFERSYYGHHEAGIDDYEAAAAAAREYQDLRTQRSAAA